MRASTVARFWAKVEKTETCWLWTGRLNRKGYGVLGKGVLVHRYVYESLVGPIPEGLTLDHLADRCGNKNCVRPDHLEPCTARENALRAVAARWGSSRAVRGDTCMRGHSLIDNTYVYATGQRVCRTCVLERGRRRGGKVAA